MAKIETEKLSVPVEGMTCASCVARVEKKLKSVDGISDVNVNFASEKASFKYDPEKVDLDNVSKLIEDSGYKIDFSSLDEKADSIDRTNDYSNEVLELKKNFILALFFTVPILILNMGMMWTSFIDFVHLTPEQINKILLILTTPVIFVAGKRFFRIFWNNLKHFSADMNSLVAIGTGAAFAFSVVVTLFPELVLSPGEFPHVYYDTTAVIITLILMGRWLESRAKSKTGTAVKKLLELQPETAFVETDKGVVEREISDLKIDDIVIVKPGGKIPADGKVISGSSSVNESMITGESIPVDKAEGSKVIGGTINNSGTFKFRITALGNESLLGQIIKMVEDAQGSKAPIQMLADKIASVFVPVVIVIALITFTGWMIAGGELAFNRALINFVAVLIIACPCALGLATPTALIVGMGKGAQNGILIKNGESLELAHKIDVLILDKTGTVTEGKPVVTDFKISNGNENETLRLLASVEQRSEHPLAKAVVEFVSSKNIDLLEPDNFNSKTGFGVEGKVDGKNILIGNLTLMRNENVELNGLTEIESEGKTLIYASINGKLNSVFIIEDKIKGSSANTIEELKQLGITPVLLTGDNKETAASVAARLNIEKFEAEVLPGDKADVVKKYQSENKIVGMVGDGINDAPALVQSDVGIAIGSGTDIAIESGDVVLMREDLNSVVDAIKLSKATIKTIKQNLFWAFIYNTLGIPLAAFGLLNPMFAALAMSLSSVSVVSNSLRLKSFKIKNVTPKKQM